MASLQTYQHPNEKAGAEAPEFTMPARKNGEPSVDELKQLLEAAETALVAKDEEHSQLQAAADAALAEAVARADNAEKQLSDLQQEFEKLRNVLPPAAPDAPTHEGQVAGFPEVTEGESIRVKITHYKEYIDGFGRVLAGDIVDLPAEIANKLIADGKAEKC